MRTKRFILLVPFIMLFHARSLAQLNPEKIHAVVDSLSRQLNRFYVFKNEAEKMSAFVQSQLLHKAYDSITNPQLFAKALTKDVKSVFRDEHFHVDYDTVTAYEVSGEIEDIPAFVEKKLNQEREKKFGFKSVEILNNNIGFIEISYFSRLNQYSKAAADSAFLKVSNCKALIIDLRYGSGGSPEMANYIISHFFAKKTHVNDIYLRKENTTIKYFTSPDPSFAKFYNMPLYVLSNHTTFSAAEALTYQLKSFKRAKIIGEKTRGGAHVVSFQPLGNGFVADIPFGKAISPVTKSNWEGQGIAPDVDCEAKDALDLAILTIETKKTNPKAVVNTVQKK
ncbi:MAG: S41 family peptidase [Bacteroidota bacterium]